MHFFRGILDTDQLAIMGDTHQFMGSNIGSVSYWIPHGTATFCRSTSATLADQLGGELAQNRDELLFEWHHEKQPMKEYPELTLSISAARMQISGDMMGQNVAE